jgi:catecholate siderophore receptor
MRIRIKIRRKRARKTWPLWVAKGTLVAYGVMGGGRPALAQSGADTAVPSVPPTENALAVRRFEIPAGRMETALAAFESASGWSVRTAKPALLDLASPGVSGLYTNAVALKKLLSGSGLMWRTLPDGSMLLDVEAAATTIDVTAAASIDDSISKYTEPLLDTPQTITSVPREVMEQQAVTSLRDALRNVAGISLAAGEGGAQGDNLTVRGFTARNDLFIDGMRDFGSYYRDPFDTEEVEVLQGPSSVMFGRGSTGGVVNQATKTPGMDRFLRGDVDLGTDLTRRGALDLNTPVPVLGSGSAFRLNLMGDQANVAGRDVAENRRYGVAPSLALGLGTPTRWTFNYLHQMADDTPDYGIPWLFNGPAPVNRANYYGFADGNFLRTNVNIGTVRYEHEFHKHFAIRNQIRYADYDRNVRITEAQIPTTVTLATPLSQIQITRNEITVKSAEADLDEQLDVTGHFHTGHIAHSVIMGVEAGRETSDPTRFTWTNVPTTSLLNPDPWQPFSGSAAVSSVVSTTAYTASVYALDTVKFSSKWELTGGLRFDRFAADYNQTVGTIASFNRVDAMPNWRSALVFKPVVQGSIYLSAGTSFNPSAETLSLSAGNADLPPEKNRTYEAGSKWDFHGSRLSITGAVFQTVKLNAREPDPDNPTLNVLAGTQRVRGEETQIHGRLAKRWSLLAGYAHLDGKVVSSPFYPLAVGAPLANVPANTFNFWSEHRLPGRWEFAVGSNYVSSRAASSTVPLDPVTGLEKQAPGYWVFNASVKHPLTEHVDFQANLYNIANRYYIDQIHPAHLVPGAGRSALIGLRFKF